MGIEVAAALRGACSPQGDGHHNAMPSHTEFLTLPGAHSTRIGAAHDMVAAGIDLTSIMHAGGWNDPKMPRYYTRELAAKDSGMARLVRSRRPGS
jgi:hypothetical protein